MEANQGPRRSVPVVSAIHFSNVQGLSGNLSDMTVAPSQYDILLCSWNLVCCVNFLGAGCLEPVGWLHSCEMDIEHFANLNLSVADAKYSFL